MPADESQRDQLDRIESLLQALESQVSEERLTRTNWRLLQGILAVHIFISYLATALMEVLGGILFFGWFVGAAVSLGCWNGLSVRTRWGRWLRVSICLLSIMFFVAFMMQVSPIELLMDVTSIFILLVGVGATLGANWVKAYLQVGLLAPTDARVTIPRISVWTIGWMVTQVAGLLVLCKVASWWGQQVGGGFQAESTYLVGFYGFGVAVVLCVAYVVMSRTDSIVQWLAVGCGLGTTLLAFNLSLTNVSSLLTPELVAGIWSWSDLEVYWGYGLAFAISQMISPVLTSVVLTVGGHRLLGNSEVE